jgi:hypothetical protein
MSLISFRPLLFFFHFLFRFVFVDFVFLSLVSFYFVFISLISFRFVSFRFCWFRFVSFSLISFRFALYRYPYCHMSKNSTASFLSKLRAKKVEKLHNSSFYRNFRKLNTGIWFRNRERLFPVLSIIKMSDTGSAKCWASSYFGHKMKV